MKRNQAGTSVMRGAKEWAGRRFRWLGACLLATLLAGCQGLPWNSSVSDLASIGSIRGPLERAFGEDETSFERGRRFAEESREDFQRAETLFADGQFDAAAKAYGKLADKYEESSIGEEARYRQAECWYAQGRYPKAQDEYMRLFEEYPSTRYVEPATKRLFEIARLWLDIPEPEGQSAVRTVSAEESSGATEEAPQPSLSSRSRLVPNLFDRSRPVFDTPGRGLQALKTIWLNDPTGPLADDALMMTATWYQRRSNPVEADRYFKILREEYPDSPHLEDAYVLGSHVRLMSYQGVHYDQRALNDAAQLKERSLTLFPASSNREQLRGDLRRLYLLRAADQWGTVEYYQAKGLPRAVALNCIRLIQEFPDTPYAEQAREALRAIDPAEIRDLPGVSDFLSTLPQQRPPEPRSAEPLPEERRSVRQVSGTRDETAPGRVRF